MKPRTLTPACARAALAALALLAAPALAQHGDHAGEPQPDLPPDLKIPESPALTPEQELATFALAEPGLRVVLAAAEPLIHDPVSAVFDEDGRLWVVEMQSYMPDIDGEGEHVPTSRIVILEDTDGDWTFDKATTFLDNLILPRSVLPCYGGALVIAPPNLLFAKDTDGDGKADDVRTLLDGFAGLDNPEHAGNGLLYGLDNWIHISQHPVEIRFDGEHLETRPVPVVGQWGITQDDRGRIYYCPNSDVLRADFLPKHYAARNPDQRGFRGLNADVCPDKSVFSSRVNPGINRGYQKPMLRDDYHLAVTTAACSPLIYRSAALGPQFYGNSFTCEPAGNCVMRVILEEKDGHPTAHRAYPDTEFLTSTDERFRPVASAVGPDGALFIVDMYRGVIQHRTYVTTFLRKQVVARGLENPIHLGRIWRIVRDGAAPTPHTRLSELSNAGLVNALDSRDAYDREHAQKLLVERRATDAASQLRQWAANERSQPTPRILALWTLQGIGELTMQDAAAAAADADPLISQTGIRLLEQWADDPHALVEIGPSTIEPGTPAQLQLALSLGESSLPQATRELARILSAGAANPLLRSAVISGLHDREVDALAHFAALSPRLAPTDATRAAFAELAATALRGSPAQRTRYLDLLAQLLPTDRTLGRIMLDQLAAELKLDSDKPASLKLASEPAQWTGTLAGGLWDLQAKASLATARLRWPGHDTGDTGPAPLSAPQRALFTLGRQHFTICAACHGPDARGIQGQAPPLAGSPIATGPEARALRVLLQGLEGPITREGLDYNGQMPAAPLPTDEDLAAVLTFVRRAFGNQADPVDPSTVARVRAETMGRPGPWTEPELLEVK
ncbi:MAG: c-type cytochrome [Phycisphaerales bacterium]|nr:c-type cytochrome [Phycisphaerales bacterium]